MSPHVLVTPPDPHWPQAYQAEATRLSAALGDEGLAFHHMGSTAIPGIHAKPVIDMLLVVRSEAVEGGATVPLPLPQHRPAG